MRRSRLASPGTRRVLASTVAAGMLATAGTACAYVRARSPDDRYNLIWPDPHVTLIVYTGKSMVSPEDFVGAATEAAATWSTPRADTSVAITIGSSNGLPAGNVFDHESTISFRTNSWDLPTYPPQALALTTVWNKGGRILETDTELNAVDPRFHWAVLPDDPAVAALSTEDDLQNALTHELGHVLGLGHPCYLGLAPTPLPFDDMGAPILSCADPTLPAAVPAATMFPSSKAGSLAERHLSSDEITALQDLYPPGRAPVVEGPGEPPASGCTVAPSPSPPSPGAAILAAALFIGATRRRK